MTSSQPLSADQAARELIRRRRARASLLDYVHAIDVPGAPVSEDEDEWLFKPIESGLADHHIYLLRALEDVAAGKCKQLMVFMPPGSAKSTYASVVFPTWFMGHKPDSRIILSSYASDIARKQGRRARQIVRSPKYRGIFGCTVSSETSAADEWALTNHAEFMAGGILSGITGNRAHGLIIDDPVKGREEADSETIRSKIRAAYDDDLTTRLIPGAWTLIIQTRWHEGDLAGSILPVDWTGESGDILCRDGLTWRVVCLPAIATRDDDPIGRVAGQPLWPEWFKDGHFERYKANPRTWSALYQQQPVPDTGDYFKKDWLRPVEKLPPLETMRVYGASDYAVTSNGGDYTVHVVIGIDPDGRMYVIDLWRRQADPSIWVMAFCDLVKKYKPMQWAEETGQIKSSLDSLITDMQAKQRAYVYREVFPTRGDKSVRAQSIRGRMAMDGLYIPHDAPWRADFESELLRFPAGVHDDQVDALGLIGQMLDRMVSGKEKDNKVKPRDDSYRTAKRSDGFNGIV